MLLQTYLEQGS